MQKDIKKPFESLIGISSLLAALLFVAGFAFRWSYYYNFGFQHLVFQLAPHSFLITAFELVRRPKNLLISILFILFPVYLLTFLERGLGRILRKDSDSLIHKLALNLSSPLASDLAKAFLIVYLTYMVASHIGYKAFQQDVINSPNNRLPEVTLLIKSTDDNKDIFPLGCGEIKMKGMHFIGDGRLLKFIGKNYLTCNIKDIKWRLLYRDNNFLYLFASRKKEIISNRKPLTLIIPNDKNLYLILK